MKQPHIDIPRSVAKYVSKGTGRLMPVFLIGNIGYGLMARKYHIDIFAWYNLIGALVIIFSSILIIKEKNRLYTALIFVELYGLMITGVICLGWEYGFQQYCIGFAASLSFAEYYTNVERKNVTLRAAIIGMGNAFIYVSLKIWTYMHEPMYAIENEMYAKVYYNMHTFIGFIFMIMYFVLYTNTVHRLECELMNIANNDPLTGIFNRRKIQQLLKERWDKRRNEDDQTVIAMFDVDHFKKVNDTYGHDAGDKVLVSLSDILKGKQEQNDGYYVSRWGGEEFLIYYETKHKSQSDIISEFESLRKQIEDTVIKSEGYKIRVTVTIGLAFCGKDDTIQSVIKTADNMLYIGKESGRNNVTW